MICNNPKIKNVTLFNNFKRGFTLNAFIPHGANANGKNMIANNPFAKLKRGL